ncbi:UNVERIFIED_CONTAM: B-box zinc finger protein 20 [Sesamum radiatum]|uniref:B-box zinc finger protein 20 n=1 Tax=Sesamum radiatum TaxID=300843 RepID=A0AAW2RV47_SESRA
MKIQCDVCAKEEASVFCTADEAALCQNCDNRVHNANKLASKHPRFSLLNPQFKESPSCDICQERRALLFCQEDRALLCRECDIPIHRANEHTKKHNRFLLTGVKLSAAASSYEAATSSSGSLSETEIKLSVTNEVNCQPNSTANCAESSSSTWRDNESSQPVSQQASDSTSSIAEYLMETLPGWHVEDLLDPSSQYGFCKIHEQMSPLINEEFRGMPDYFIQRHACAFTSYAS